MLGEIYSAESNLLISALMKLPPTVRSRSGLRARARLDTQYLVFILLSLQGATRRSSLDGACSNQAEEYFCRLRRAEIGIHHHTAGAYLLRCAQESS